MDNECGRAERIPGLGETKALIPNMMLLGRETRTPKPEIKQTKFKLMST